MKYFFLVWILAGCGLAYVRLEQPKIWNASLTALKAPEEASGVSTSDGTPVSAPPAAVTAASPPPAAVAAAAPPPDATADTANTPAGPPPPVTAPEVISPTSTAFINPDHVRQVDQPTQPAAPFVPPNPLPAQPNWTWSVLGKDYHNVVVTQVEADYVQIVYDGGEGTINTSDLPPDLQKMFNYDPNRAKVAEEAETARLAALDQQHALEVQQQAQAASPAPVSSVPSPQTSAPLSSGVTPGQRASIQSQINDLQSDITMMQADLARHPEDEWQRTHGAYPDKIAADQAQISQLQAELR